MRGAIIAMLLGSVLCVTHASANGMVGHQSGRHGHIARGAPFRVEINPLFFDRHFRERHLSRRFGGREGFGPFLPFFGGELVDGFDDFGVAAPPVFAGSLMPPPLAFPPPPRRLANERATVETEQGVQIVRGPGSHHLLR